MSGNGSAAFCADLCGARVYTRRMFGMSGWRTKYGQSMQQIEISMQVSSCSLTLPIGIDSIVIHRIYYVYQGRVSMVCRPQSLLGPGPFKARKRRACPLASSLPVEVRPVHQSSICRNMSFSRPKLNANQIIAGV